MADCNKRMDTDHDIQDGTKFLVLQCSNYLLLSGPISAAKQEGLPIENEPFVEHIDHNVAN